MCTQLIQDFDSTLPDSIEQLTSLSGIGRKTANLIMGDVFHQPAVVVDTHCIRITNRLGLVQGEDPYKLEIALKKILPPHESSDFCHRLVLFGREICKARKPLCENCTLQEGCAFWQKNNRRSNMASIWCQCCSGFFRSQNLLGYYWFYHYLCVYCILIKIIFCICFIFLFLFFN